MSAVKKMAVFRAAKKMVIFLGGEEIGVFPKFIATFE